MSDRDQHFMPMYAGAIHEAVRSGDAETMRSLAERAEREGGDDPEIQAAYGKLVSEISRIDKRPYEPRVLYGVALQSARASGDQAQMRRLAERARGEGSNDPSLLAALEALEAEIERAFNKGGGFHTLYAGPIHEATRSGDLQQMLDIQSRARSEGANDPKIQAALGELEKEIQRLRGS